MRHRKWRDYVTLPWGNPNADAVRHGTLRAVYWIELGVSIGINPWNPFNYYDAHIRNIASRLLGAML